MLAVERPPPPILASALYCSQKRIFFAVRGARWEPTQCRSASAGGQNGMRHVVRAKLSALSRATSSESRVRARLTRLLTVPAEISQIAATCS
jgi:hypothetical protein